MLDEVVQKEKMEKTVPVNVYKQDYSNLNEDFVLNGFALIQWQDAFRESQNVNQLFEVFFSECSRIVNKHLPLKKLSRKEVKFNSKPWITRALQKSIKHKDILYRQFLRTKSSHSHFKINIKYIETNLSVYCDLAKSFITVTTS